jgi:hypothetical protein
MNKNFQSDLTEAFAKLNQVPLALFPSDENPEIENFFNIYIEMTGTYFILYSFKNAYKMLKAVCSSNYQSILRPLRSWH